MLNCEEASERITESLAAPLPRTAAAELEAHLAVCEHCRAEAWDLRRIWRELERMPEEEPSAEMSARFAAMLEPHEEAARRGGALRRLTERSVAGLERFLEPLLPRRTLAQAGLAAALLAAGIFLGGGGHWPWAGAASAHQNEIAGLRQEVRSLSQLVTLSLLQQDSASERLRGVSFGREAGGGDQRVLGALLDTLNHDPDVNVRLAAVDALAPTVGRPMVRDQLLQEVGKQPSPMVQIALIDVLLAHDRAGSRQRLLELSADLSLDPTVRDYLRSRLHQVS